MAIIHATEAGPEVVVEEAGGIPVSLERTLRHYELAA
jgi:hypothetical protein